MVRRTSSLLAACAVLLPLASGCRGFIRPVPRDPFPEESKSRFLKVERRHDPRVVIEPERVPPERDCDRDPFAERGESRLEGRVQVVDVSQTRDLDRRLRADITVQSRTDRPLDVLYRIRFFDPCQRLLDGPGLGWRPLHLDSREKSTLTMIWPDPSADSFTLDLWDKTE
ncbi:MAG: DUF1425 domain-containing protein [Planctomycetes bacterium]|nr:DUF1425 domain-containing protein [Planctomycetota bacterium]